MIGIKLNNCDEAIISGNYFGNLEKALVSDNTEKIVFNDNEMCNNEKPVEVNKTKTFTAKRNRSYKSKKEKFERCSIKPITFKKNKLVIMIEMIMRGQI